MSLRYLTIDDVRYVHDRLMTVTGGLPGVRDEIGLASTLTRMRIAVNGGEAFHDLHARAGALFLSLVRDRPFHDGNKRAAIAAVAVFLRLNGEEIFATDHEIVDLCRAGERGSLTAEQVRDWLRTHAVKAA